MPKYGKKNKTKFVLRKELIILVLVLIAMLVTTIILQQPSKSEKALAEFNDQITAYNLDNGTSYGTLEEGHVFKKAKIDDITETISSSAKGTEENPKVVFVLYGSLANAKTLENLTAINNEAKNREVKTVYIYSSTKVEKQEDKEDVEFLAEIHKNENKLNSSVSEGIDEIDLLEVPALYVYKNGELVFNSVMLEDEGFSWNIIINKAFSLAAPKK